MLKKWIVVTVALLIMLSGCNQEKGVVKDHPEKKIGENLKGDKEPSFHFPLTGIGTEKEANDRAVAVVVNNHPQARPQSGLHKADIVYEVLAEGNVTRFLAIFGSERPENIGPVRSVRPYFLDLAKGYDSFFIAHGYSPEAKEMLDSGSIDHLNGMQHDGTLFKRADFRKAPHNSYITFEDIEKGAKKGNYKMNKAPVSLAFLDETQVDQLAGQEANEVMVSYGDPSFDVEYQYDTDKDKYHRFSSGEETIDLDSKEDVLIDNVMVVEMDHQTIDNNGRKGIDLESGGSGYLMQKGVMNEVEWQNVDGRILPYINGKEVGFIPGRTWINIVPTLERVSFGLQ